MFRGASPRPISQYITEDEDGVNWIKIGDTVTGKKYVTRTAQRVTPLGATKSRRVKKGDFILSNSMSFGRPYILQIDGCVHDGWLVLTDYQENFDADFLYHLLSSNAVQRQFGSKTNKGSVQNLNSDIVKSVSVPVPSLTEQSRIVSILDKFDKLTTDISEGLPAEINARRKQYEHYRGKLLTFKELAHV